MPSELMTLLCPQPAVTRRPTMGRPIDSKSIRQRALAYIRQRAYATTPALREDLGLTERQANTVICRLREDGLIVGERYARRGKLWRAA